MKTSCYLVLLLISVWSYCVLAQSITETPRNEIINSVIDQLASRYVDPNLGKKAADTIRQKKK